VTATHQLHAGARRHAGDLASLDETREALVAALGRVP
jgi:hypothetical protein